MNNRQFIVENNLTLLSNATFIMLIRDEISKNICRKLRHSYVPNGRLADNSGCAVFPHESVK
jgi:hypothetical protein